MDIITPRLTLRPFDMADAPALQAILGDAETMTYLEPPYDPPKTEAFLRDFCIARKGALAAALRETGRVIGYLLFKEIESGIYELGWVFHRGYWRQGYASEASEALLHHAFEALRARKVVAETVDAVKAAGLMRRLGMRQVGAERLASPDHDGQELLLFELSREEYRTGMDNKNRD